MKNISCSIVVKNNPPHLLETVNSVIDFVSEIVIFDIGLSQDLQEKLVSYQKIKIIKIKKKVPYVELIREEMKRYLKNEWILYLDPDEVFPKEALNILKQELNNYDCFSFPRKNIIFGRFIRYSRFWPDYQTRLFKKDKVFWSKEIHSKPEIKGREYLLPAKEELALVHYNYENLDQWFEKYLRYAKSEADYYFSQNRDFNFLTASKKSLTEFISRFFAGEGYKDGIHGLVLAILQMFYYLVVYFYYWEKKQYQLKEEEKKLPFNLYHFFKRGEEESFYWLKEKKLINGFISLKELIKKKLGQYFTS